MRLKLILLLFLFLLVAISGCTAPQTGNGVVITEFYTDFDEVMSGERVDFYLRVKNLGSLTAENVFAELLGLDVAWYNENTSNNDLWTSEKERLPNEAECRFYPGTGFSLLPPNPFFGTAGEEHVCTWTYLAPGVPSGMSSTYEPSIRVYYNYKTEATTSITLLSREEMIRLQNTGGSPSAHIISKSSSPIDIDVGIQPSIRVSWDSKALKYTATFPLEITLNNVGGGVPCLKGMCKKHGVDDHIWDYVTMDIKLYDDLSFVECEIEKTDKTCTITPSLYTGSNAIVVKIKANIGEANVPQQKRIDITLDYSYFVNKKFFLEIIG